MKLLALLSAGALAIGTLAATPATAQPYGHGYRHGHGYHGGYRHGFYGRGWRGGYRHRVICRVHRGYYHAVRRCY